MVEFEATNQQQDPRSDLKPIFLDHYTTLYKGEKSDSPEFSRVSLIRRFRPQLLTLTSTDFVLDLGAGRQIFERQYLSTYGHPLCQIISLDMAYLKRFQLLAGRSQRITHIQADGAHLPFVDRAFSLVVSNMAFDFMPEEAIQEVHRVLKPGGRLLVNFHHPFLIPNNIGEKIKRGAKSKGIQTVHEVWGYMQEHNILFSNPTDITDKFKRFGFKVETAKEARAREDIWWEVDMQKAATS